MHRVNCSCLFCMVSRGSQMEHSTATSNNKQATDSDNSQLLAEPVSTGDESSTFDFAESSWMSDFVLVVEGTRFYVTKNILALASPVFERMFQSEFKESSTNEMELPGKAMNDVLAFLRYIYPDAPSNLTPEAALGILPLTEEYQVSKLKRRCEQALIESISLTSSALELFKVLQQACLYALEDLRKKCINLISEKTTAELNEARQKFQVPTETLIEILETKVKTLEFTALMEKQQKEIEKLNEEKAMTKEELEVIQQYFETKLKVTLFKAISPDRHQNWKSEQVVLIVNVKSAIIAVKEVIIWNTPLQVSASNTLNIRIENRGLKIICDFAVNAILVCRQPKGKNEQLKFCDSFSLRKQSICKKFESVTDINSAEKGFVRNGKIGLIIHLYMSEPNI